MQSPGTAVSSTAAARLVIGVAQGIALHLLYLAAEKGDWPATHGMVFAPLILAEARISTVRVPCMPLTMNCAGGTPSAGST